MDADTRHHLKQNELAEALNKLRRLDNPTTRYGLLAVAVVLAVIGAWKLWNYSQQHALEQSWQHLTTVQAAVSNPDPTRAASARDKLQTFIADTSNPDLTGYARLQLAELQIRQADNLPLGQRKETIQRAAALLREITTVPDTSPMLVAAASFALASTHESLRQMDQARQVYESLVNNEARFAGSPYVAMAAKRLQNIDALAVAVTFTPGSQPPPLPMVDGPPGPDAPPTSSVKMPPSPRRVSLGSLLAPSPTVDDASAADQPGRPSESTAEQEGSSESP